MFVHSDEASRLDSNSKRVVTVKDLEGSKAKHARRTWEDSTWGENHTLFSQSEIVRDYLAKHQNYKIQSFTSFYKNSSKYIINPSHESCVDAIKSRMHHHKKAIFKELSHDQELKHQLLTCDCPLHSLPKEKKSLPMLTLQ